jgi:hypothetical protein
MLSPGKERKFLGVPEIVDEESIYGDKECG